MTPRIINISTAIRQTELTNFLAAHSIFHIEEIFSKPPVGHAALKVLIILWVI